MTKKKIIAFLNEELSSKFNLAPIDLNNIVQIYGHTVHYADGRKPLELSDELFSQNPKYRGGSYRDDEDNEDDDAKHIRHTKETVEFLKSAGLSIIEVSWCPRKVDLKSSTIEPSRLTGLIAKEVDLNLHGETHIESENVDSPYGKTSTTYSVVKARVSGKIQRFYLEETPGEIRAKIRAETKRTGAITIFKVLEPAPVQ